MRKSSAAKQKPVKTRVTYAQKPPALVRWGTCAFDGIPLLVGVGEDDAICRVAFVREQKPAAVTDEWKKNWKKTKFVRDQKAVEPVAKALGGKGAINLTMIGTEFQCAVWKNLLAIPRGEVVTYAELARRSKRPKAVRAAGTACGANPVAILVPCHRVIASDGSLGGFGGGLPAKRKLLAGEGFAKGHKK